MRAQSLRILLREASKQTIDDGRFDMTSGEEQIVGLLARRRRDTRDLVVLVFDQTIMTSRPMAALTKVRLTPKRLATASSGNLAPDSNVCSTMMRGKPS